MIKLIAGVLLAMIIAAFTAFLASLDHPVTLPIGDMQIYISLGLLLGAALLLFFMGGILIWLWMRLQLDFPIWGYKAAVKRQAKGFQVLNQALVALAAGHPASAERLLARAEKALPPQPLLPLLGAEIALRAGQVDLAKSRFKQLEAMADGRLLGLRGLVLLGQREGQPGEVLAMVRQIIADDPTNLWALETWFSLEVRAGHWEGAEEALDKAKKQKLFPRPQEDQHRAAIALAKAREALLKNQPSAAAQFLKAALKYRPNFTPALLLQGQLMKDNGAIKQAEKILEQGYKKMPHPALIKAYQAFAAQALPKERLKRLRHLTRTLEGHPLSLQALGQAAIEAGEIEMARQIVADLSGFPLRKGRAELALALAKTEGASVSALELARLEKAVLRAPDEAHWTCNSCGREQDHWSALCGVCGAFDQFIWQDDQYEGALVTADSGSVKPFSGHQPARSGALLLLGPEATAHPMPRPKR